MRECGRKDARLEGKWQIVGLGLLSTLMGCSGASEGMPVVPGSDSYARGTQALALQAAPAGLCEGGGADRQCEEGAQCTSSRGSDTSGAPSTTATQGAGGTLNAAPIASEQLPGAPSPSSDAYYGAATGGDISNVGGAITGTGGASSVDMTCAGTWDGGVCVLDPADGGVGTPSQFNVSRSQFALTACSTLDMNHPATLYLSADDSNSTASATIARKLIRSGFRVPASVLRTYEFLNYYDFAFEPAEPGEVRMVPQLSSCPENGQLSFQVALQAEAREPSDRAPLNITFVLDTSGSMSGEPIALEQAAVRAVASVLREGDVVSMVTWSTDQNDILSGYQVTGPQDATLLSAASELTANGGTNLSAGLQRGYALANAYYARDRINRVILISDGQANVGVTDGQLIARYADDEEGDNGIYLAGIGVGTGVNDTLMDAVTDAGRGAYLFLDSYDEAQKMLADHFLEVVDVAARDVRLEVKLPWYLGVEKFYGEVISTDPTEVRPQHLAPNSAMLFFQVLKACDPALLHGDDRVSMRATWTTPLSREEKEVVRDTTLNDLAGDDRKLTKAAAVAGYAEALAGCDGVDYGACYTLLDDALEAVHTAQAAQSDPDLTEIAALLQSYMAQFPL